MDRVEKLRRLLGRNIAYWRHRRKMTQAALAEYCDISDVALSRIENGSSWMHDETLAAIIEGLNISPHLLLLDDRLRDQSDELQVSDYVPKE